MTKWTPVHEQNKVARKPCLRLATAHGTCGFANGRLVNCNNVHCEATAHGTCGFANGRLVNCNDVHYEATAHGTCGFANGVP